MYARVPRQRTPLDEISTGFISMPIERVILAAFGGAEHPDHVYHGAAIESIKRPDGFWYHQMVFRAFRDTENEIVNARMYRKEMAT